MGSERGHALLLAALASIPALLASGLFIPLLSRAAKGRLQRNQWVGIRTPSTMSSDQAWMAGHRAALRLMPLYLLTTVITCVALFAAALFASTTNVVLLVGAGAAGAVLAVFLYSAFIASRAAKLAEGRPGNRQRQ